MRKIIFIFILLFSGFSVSAQQDCSFAPAPCPSSSDITETLDINKRSENKDVYPKELEMETRMRNLLTNEVQRIAKANGWQVYELIEGGLTGPPLIYISYDAWEAAPFDKRTPHKYAISFIFVTNRDSLKAWQNWLQNDVPKQEDAYAAAYSQDQSAAEQNPLMKEYYDSMMYYGTKRSEYALAHNDEYFKALQDKNQKVIDAHDAYLKKMEDKYNAFEKKYEEAGKKAYSNSNQSSNNFDSYVDSKTLHYAGNSIALVNFGINEYRSDFGLEDNEQKDVIPDTRISIPGAFFAGITHNKNKLGRNSFQIVNGGYAFNNPPVICCALFGKYLPIGSYNSYPAAFTKGYGTLASTLGPVKDITCEKVQNLQVEIEGADKQVHTIQSQMNWTLLSSQIYHK